MNKFFHSAIFPPFILACFCIAAFWPTLNSGFKLDDFIYSDPQRHLPYASLLDIFTKSLNHHYNPIDILGNDLFFGILGCNPILLHGLNLVIFWLNGYLLYLMSCRITGNVPASLIAAFFFCAHPVNAEIMNQVIFSTVLMQALMLQFSFIMFDRYLVSGKVLEYIIALISAGIAYLTLETSWIFPAVILTWGVVSKPGSFKNTFKRTLPFWIAVLVLFLIWCLLTSHNSLSTPYGLKSKMDTMGLNSLTFAGSLLFLCFWYISKLLVPLKHIWIYSIPPLENGGAVLCILSAMAAGSALTGIFLSLKAGNTKRMFGFLGLWFFLGFIFLPVGSLAHPDSGLVIEPYWFYFSSMPFFIAAGWLVIRIRREIPRAVYYFVLGGMFLCLMILGQRFNAAAKTEKEYCKYWLSISMNPIPLTTLARSEYVNRNYQEALNYYRIYLEKFSASPYAEHSSSEITGFIGEIYSEMGDFKNAERMIARALTLDDQSPVLYTYRAQIQINAGDFGNAEQSLIKASLLDPKYYPARAILLDLFLRNNDLLKARALLAELAHIEFNKTKRTEILSKLAAVQYLAGEKENTLNTIEEILKSDSGPMTYLRLAEILADFKLFDIAQIIMTQALSLYPQHRELKLLSGKIRAFQALSSRPQPDTKRSGIE